MNVGFKQRFLNESGGRPYAWAAKLGIPKGIVTAVIRGDDNYRPIKRSLDIVVEKTGKSALWWLDGIEKIESKVAQERGSYPIQNVRNENVVPMHKSGNEPVKPQVLDRELLAMAEQALEEFAAERELRVKPEKRAEIVAFLYEWMVNGGDLETAASALRAAAGG